MTKYSTSAKNSDPLDLLTNLTIPRFKVRYHDSPWFFPVNMAGPITDMSSVIFQGLGALEGKFPKTTSDCQDWLIFDKTRLQLSTAAQLDRLPAGSELIFVPVAVARPVKVNTSEPR